MTSEFVLFSGGLDSSVMLWSILSQREAKKVVAINIGYGSTHNEAERNAACNVVGAARLKFPYIPVYYEEISLPTDIFEGSNSKLFGGTGSVVVPFRNGTFISVAAARAMSSGDSDCRVWTAVHASDHGNWVFPDCSPEFMGAMANAVWVASTGSIRLMTPFVNLQKAGVVAMGDKYQVPMGLTWSCYSGGSKHCGVCVTCRERKHAFNKAGVTDPTEYAK